MKLVFHYVADTEAKANKSSLRFVKLGQTKTKQSEESPVRCFAFLNEWGEHLCESNDWCSVLAQGFQKTKQAISTVIVKAQTGRKTNNKNK